MINSIGDIETSDLPVEVTLVGKVFKKRIRCDRDGEPALLSGGLVDQGESIFFKYYSPTNSETQFFEEGDWLRLEGTAKLQPADESSNTRLHVNPDEPVVFVDRFEKVDPNVRSDDHPEPRVELSCHTNNSSADSVLDVEEVIERASWWDHPAVAVTDRGGVHSFPEAAKAGEQHDVQIIYGLEANILDDDLQAGSVEDLRDPEVLSEFIKSNDRGTFSATLLASTQDGLENLYQLVSESHLHYYHQQPWIPKSLLTQNRDGLIVGSDGPTGEVCAGVFRDESDETVQQTMGFYDFVGVQPPGILHDLISDKRYPGITSTDDIEEQTERLLDRADDLEVTVVATGDVQFLQPEDRTLRAILQHAGGTDSPGDQPPLYYRSTDEMLESFEFLGANQAEQIVIKNPKQIAQQCQPIEPIPEGFCGPNIADSPDQLTEIARDQARKRYGDQLPDPVDSRLRKEIESIRDHGFEDAYLIAKSLADKSREEGYPVGIRGTVGSSLVAYLLGITDSNPLPPHYRCANCRQSHFPDDGNPDMGIDRPARDCSECGENLKRDGFKVPFEVFAGPQGDKVPDIDLNFSGDILPKIFQHLQELVGAGNLYRAGSRNNLPPHIANFWVEEYFGKKNLELSTAEQERLTLGLQGVKRSPGQHPGGWIVIPEGRSIHEFSPVEYPFEDQRADVPTTQIDYKHLSDHLLKVDLLGHDDPTRLKQLQTFTGIDPGQIPLDDPRTLELFRDISVLGVDPQEIGLDIGTKGIPEFSTDFVIGMINKVHPTSFGDLARLSGLSHGDGVWLENADDLIADGKATIKSVIAFRDDIMNRLTEAGMSREDSYQVMEDVRHGRRLDQTQTERMSKSGVPEWFVESCQKINYVFPKSHAVSYTKNAFRLAYFKYHHPAAFYASYFNVKGDDLEPIYFYSREERETRLNLLDRLVETSRANAAQMSERDHLLVLKEAYLRGIDFLKPSSEHTDQRSFTVAAEDKIWLPEW